MSKPNLKQKHGVTRGKIIAVAVLLVVFVGVLISQFAGSGPSQLAASKSEATEPKTETKRPKAPPRKSQSPGAVAETIRTNVPRSERVTRTPVSSKTAQSPAPNKEVEMKDAATWPSVSLSTVTRHDPFALPAKVQHDLEAKLQDEQKKREEAEQKAMEEKRAAVKRFAETLQQAGVDMVMIDGNERVARIGEKTFRVGDVINDCLRVREIRDDAVIIIEPLLPDGDR